MNIDQLRADTPGVESVNHLLASGASLMPACVVDAITRHIELEATIGGYEAQAAQAELLDSVYTSVAELIGAKCTEIALMENATAAWCHAFYGLNLKNGQRIITCEAEYAANYVAFLQCVKNRGVTIDVIPSGADGALDLHALEDMLDERVGLIAITWVPTNGGLVNPACGVGRIANHHGIPYLLDACQAVGQMPVDVEEIGCDFLSATGRKYLRGPRGTGFLYVSERVIESIEPVVIDHFSAPWVSINEYRLRDDARRFENWENSYALRAGLGAAVRYALDIGLNKTYERVRYLAERFRRQVKTIPGAVVRDIGVEKCGIVSFTVESLDPGLTVANLRQKRINIGASDPASTRLDAEARALPTMLRMAPHYYNTEEDVDSLVDALDELRCRNLNTGE